MRLPRRCQLLMVVVCVLSCEGVARAELVGAWRLDEGSGTTVRDWSPGMNDGVVPAAKLPEWSTDVAPTSFANPYSLRFDPTALNYVDTTYEGIGEDNARTISAWVKTSSTAGQAIVAYGARDGDGRKWHFRINPDGDPRVPGAIRTEAQGGNQTGDMSVADGQWHHVVSVFPQSGDNFDVRHYVDGVLQGETGTTDEPIFTGVGDGFPLVSIGARRQSPPALENYMDGWIDDVRMYDRELTDQEIKNLVSTPTSDGLVAYWNFDDGPGNLTATDRVAGNDGELIGAAGATIAWVADDSPPLPSPLQAVAEFNGIDAYIQTTFPGIADDADRSVAFWVRTTDDINTHGIVAWGDDLVNGSKWHLRVNNNAGNGTVGAIRTEVEGGFNIGSTVIADGEWHHVVSVFQNDGTPDVEDVVHYVDGVLDDMSGFADEPILTAVGPPARDLSIGRRMQDGNQHFFTGRLADVRVFDHALTAEEILAIMNGEGLGGLPGDFNGNGLLDAGDIDLLSAEVQQMTHNAYFDLNDDNLVNETDRSLWVEDAEFRYTYFGDSNLDNVFNSADFVQVFLAGKYETSQSAGWADGDWNGDGEFTSGDFVVSFLGGGYELGPRAALVAVPEPTSLSWTALIVSSIGSLISRQSRSRT